MPYGPDDILTEAETAAVLHTSLRTLRRWRTEGKGPPWARVSNRPLYRYAAILEWLQSREETEAIQARLRRAEWLATQERLRREREGSGGPA